MDKHLQALDEPLDVQAVDGEVAIIGPDGMGLSLTPHAAIVSARRLLEAAGEADPATPYQKPLG